MQFDAANLPRHKGSYLLLLELSSPETISIGRLGALDFLPGYYAYTGSARGPGGLAARLGRHLKAVKPCHWHIDYLRRKASVVGIWAGWGQEAVGLGECRLATLLTRRLSLQHPHKGFGSSDCTCHSHLLYWSLAKHDRQAKPARALVQMEKALLPMVRLV